MNPLAQFQLEPQFVDDDENLKDELCVRAFKITQRISEERLAATPEPEHDGLPMALFVRQSEGDESEDLVGSSVRYGVKITLPQPVTSKEALDDLEELDCWKNSHDSIEINEGDVILTIYSEAFELELTEEGEEAYEEYQEQREELEEQYPNLKDKDQRLQEAKEEARERERGQK